MTRLVIWGAGELGSRVAAHWAGGPVVGLTKTRQRHASLAAMGVEPQLGSAVPLLRADDTMLLALPGDETKAAAIAALSDVRAPRRAVLVSTTGYYGTPQGIVDEETPAGTEPRARAVGETEQSFLRWAGEAGVVIRLGGLYCRGRGPAAALARRGSVSRKPPNRTLPLIHYDDAAAAIATALRRPSVETVYLGVTPPCPTRREFYEAACAHLGLPPPPFADPLPFPPAGFDVTYLRRDLLPQARFPDWRAALQI